MPSGQEEWQSINKWLIDKQKLVSVIKKCCIGFYSETVLCLLPERVYEYLCWYHWEPGFYMGKEKMCL